MIYIVDDTQLASVVMRAGFAAPMAVIDRQIARANRFTFRGINWRVAVEPHRVRISMASAQTGSILVEHEFVDVLDDIDSELAEFDGLADMPTDVIRQLARMEV